MVHYIHLTVWILNLALITIKNIRALTTYFMYRRVSRGGGGLGPPPLEIEKQKKKKVIRTNIKLFHIYFVTFLVENIIFSASF